MTEMTRHGRQPQIVWYVFEKNDCFPDYARKRLRPGVLPSRNMKPLDEGTIKAKFTTQSIDLPAAVNVKSSRVSTLLNSTPQKVFYFSDYPKSDRLPTAAPQQLQEQKPRILNHNNNNMNNNGTTTTVVTSVSLVNEVYATTDPTTTDPASVSSEGPTQSSSLETAIVVPEPAVNEEVMDTSLPTASSATTKCEGSPNSSSKDNPNNLLERPKVPRALCHRTIEQQALYTKWQNTLLSSKLKKRNQAYVRLSKKLETVESELATKNKELDGVLPKVLDEEGLPTMLKLLLDVERQKNKKKNLHHIRYPEELKRIAIRLYEISPECYNYLQKELTLPNRSSINAWVSNFEPETKTDLLGKIDEVEIKRKKIVKRTNSTSNNS